MSIHKPDGTTEHYLSKPETYCVLVRYRTNSGCNTKLVKVEAESSAEALDLATAKVRRMRGVIRIDGGDWHAEDER